MTEIYLIIMKLFRTFFIQIQKSSTSTFTLMVEKFDWSRSVSKEIAPELARTRYPRGVLYVLNCALPIKDFFSCY
jgi:hypothetical protein